MTPLVYTASTLQQVLPEGYRALRLTDSDSLTPLDPCRGFIATRFSSQCCRPPNRRERLEDILTIFDDRRGDDGDTISHFSTNEVDDMVEHVCGGWGTRSRYDPYASEGDSEDDYSYWASSNRSAPHFDTTKTSPWISASQDLQWTIWEISRRLTVCRKSKIDLSVIRTESPSDIPPQYKGARVVSISPREYLCGLRPS